MLTNPPSSTKHQPGHGVGVKGGRQAFVAKDTEPLALQGAESFLFEDMMVIQDGAPQL